MGEIPEDEQGKQDWEKNFIFKTKEVEKDFEKRIKGECYRKGDIEGFQGSLHFYPTYFDRMGLEVINPHDREGGAGMNPIYFECVPAITRDKDGKEVHTGGTFTLLYVPIVGPEVSEEGAKKDLEAVARGIGAMMTHYGFGAKTSSGFGVAKVEPDKANVEPLDFKQAWLDGWKTEG
jgi:CRISPR-associated protein Cmr2